MVLTTKFVYSYVVLCLLPFIYLTLGEGQCNTEITDSSGEVSSPNYPYNYPHNVYCTWSIQAPVGLSVHLTITDFHLTPPTSDICSDYLLVLNGTVNEPQNILFKSCGDGIWQNTIVSTSHVMTLVFYSDHYGSAGGFHAQFAHVAYREEFLVMADGGNNIIFVNVLAAYNTFHIPLASTNVPKRSIEQLDFDPVDRMIYFTDSWNDVIGRINLDGVRQSEILISDIQDVGGIAVNYVSRLLVWTDNRGVFVSNLDGGYRFKLGDTTFRTKDLAIDQLSSLVYWVTGQSTPQISRVEGDGTDFVPNFVDGNMLDPTGLTLDVNEFHSVLYWCDKLQSRIEKINTDGSGREVIAAPPGTIRSPIDLTIDTRDNLYWSEDNQGGLDFLSADGSHYGEYILLGKERDIVGITVYSSDYVFDHFWRVCGTDENGGCEELCLPNSFQFTCQNVLPVIVNCPDNILKWTKRFNGEDVAWGIPLAHSPISSHVPVIATSTHNPGDLFAVGTTIVQYTFSDVYGNTADCVFTVRVSLEQVTRPPSGRITTTQRYKEPQQFPLSTMLIVVSILFSVVIFLISICCVLYVIKRTCHRH